MSGHVALLHQLVLSCIDTSLHHSRCMQYTQKLTVRLKPCGMFEARPWSSDPVSNDVTPHVCSARSVLLADVSMFVIVCCLCSINVLLCVSSVSAHLSPPSVRVSTRRISSLTSQVIQPSGMMSFRVADASIVSLLFITINIITIIGVVFFCVIITMITVIIVIIIIVFDRLATHMQLASPAVPRSGIPLCQNLMRF